MQTNYANEASFKVYIDYLALKKHFTTDGYDYKKYNGKVKASFDTFQTRNDAFFFYKLSKRPESHDIMLANMIKNPKVWVRDLCDESAEEVYLDWKKRIDGLTYQFEKDLSKLKEDYKTNFEVPQGGQYPHLLNLFIQRQISLETFSILTHISNVFPYWEKDIVDKYIASDMIKLCKKYYPFLEVDTKKFTSIIKKRFF
jgi:hypothetical protein